MTLGEHTDGLRPAAAWYVVTLLTFAYLFALLDRTVVTLLIAPIQQDLHITDTQFGLLQGLSFGIFYLLGGLPIGWLVDRMSRVRIITAGVAAWSMLTMFSGLASTFKQLFLTRIGVGIGEAALNPTAYSLLADLFPRDKLSRAIAVFSSGAMIGTGLAYAFGGALMAALMLTLREPSRAGRERVSSHVPWRALTGFLCLRRTIIFLHFGAFSCLGVLIWSFLTWGPAFLFRSHGLSGGIVGITMGVATGLLGTLGFFLGGALADFWLRKGQPDAHMKVGFFAMLAALPVGLMVALCSSAAVATIGMCILIFLLMTPVPAGIAALQLITPPLLRGRISALYMVVVNFAGLALGPVFVALLTDYVFHSMAAIGVALAIITVMMASLSALGFGLGRRLMGACILEGSRE
jgi:MFS family permease